MYENQDNKKYLVRSQWNQAYQKSVGFFSIIHSILQCLSDKINCNYTQIVYATGRDRNILIISF